MLCNSVVIQPRSPLYHMVAPSSTCSVELTRLIFRNLAEVGFNASTRTAVRLLLFALQWYSGEVYLKIMDVRLLNSVPCDSFYVNIISVNQSCVKYFS